MNKILKTAFVAAGVVGTVGAVSTAEAASFNVVVDKIEVFTDGDDVSTGVTIYDPANNIGATSTQTVDLFDAAQKTGTILGVAVPPANTYETVILHFSEMEISGTTVASDISATFEAANSTVAEFNPANLGNLFVALGNVSTGAGSVANAYGVTAGIPMQPTTIAGSGFTFPALNLELDEATVDDNATTAAALVGALPAATTVASDVADSATRPNLNVAVNWANAFDPISTTASYTSGTSVISVGLFDTALSARPYQVETIQSSTSAVSGSVEFVDVVSATVVPLAWLDADSDGKLDAGEYFAAGADLDTAGATVASLREELAQTVIPTGVTDISTTATAAGGASIGFQNIFDGDGIDQQAIEFGPRTQSIVVAMPTTDVTATQDNNGWDALAGLTAAIGSNSAAGDDTVDVSAASATLTVVYALPGGISRTVILPGAVGADGAAATGDAETGEDVFVGLPTSTTVANTTGLSWAVSGTAGALTIANIPLTIDALDDGENTGTYAAEFKFTFADANDTFAPTTFGRVVDATTGGGAVNSDGTSNITIVTGAAATGDISVTAPF